LKIGSRSSRCEIGLSDTPSILHYLNVSVEKKQTKAMPIRCENILKEMLERIIWFLELVIHLVDVK
jgi:hypothetical protein